MFSQTYTNFFVHYCFSHLRPSLLDNFFLICSVPPYCFLSVSLLLLNYISFHLSKNSKLQHLSAGSKAVLVSR